MRKYRKYTQELLTQVAKESNSIVDMMRKMELNVASGGTHNHISKLLRQFDIDTKHFNPNPGVKNGHGKKKSINLILRLRKNGTRTAAYQLRRSLIESGREYKCECCGQEPIWNNKELRLQVDHKNGNYLDDRSENLRFICPNCHTQTPNYCQNKGKTGLCNRSKKRKDKPIGDGTRLESERG